MTTRRWLAIGAAILLGLGALLFLRFGGADAPAEDAAAPVEDAPAQPEPRLPTTIGYVEGFKRAYEQQPRDPQAAATEARIRALFGTEHVPRDMLLSVECHKIVCKMRVRWTRPRALAYIGLLVTTTHEINSEVAAEVPGVPDRAGNLDIDVYVLREGVRKVE